MVFTSAVPRASTSSSPGTATPQIYFIRNLAEAQHPDWRTTGPVFSKSLFSVVIDVLLKKSGFINLENTKNFYLIPLIT